MSVRSSVYDLHLVRHRLREILERFEDPQQGFSEFALQDAEDDLYRLERLVGSMINGYQKDAEADISDESS